MEAWNAVNTLDPQTILLALTSLLLSSWLSISKRTENNAARMCDSLVSGASRK